MNPLRDRFPAAVVDAYIKFEASGSDDSLARFVATIEDQWKLVRVGIVSEDVARALEGRFPLAADRDSFRRAISILLERDQLHASENRFPKSLVTAYENLVTDLSPSTADMFMHALERAWPSLRAGVPSGRVKEALYLRFPVAVRQSAIRAKIDNLSRFGGARIPAHTEMDNKKREKPQSGQVPQLAADDPRLKTLFNLMTMKKVFNVPLNTRTQSIAAEEALLVTDSGKSYLKAYTRDPKSPHSDEEVIWGGAEGYKVLEMACLIDGIDGVVIDDEDIIPMSLILMMHLMPPPIPGFQPNTEVTRERLMIALAREAQ